MDHAREAVLFRWLDDGEAARLHLDLTLPAGDRRPYTVMNTVTTVDGKVALLGRATGVGSEYDRLLMKRLRAAAEGVMVGAGTLRAEEIEFRFPPELLAGRRARGLAEPLVVVVVTAGGALPRQRRLFANPSPAVVPVVLTTEDADVTALVETPAAPRVLRAGQNEVDLFAGVAALFRDYGVRRLVLEGGPRLNQSMLSRGLVDEVFHTLAPKLLGGSAPTMLEGPAPLPIPVPLALLSIFAYRGELFLRYRVG